MVVVVPTAVPMGALMVKPVGLLVTATERGR
jgi:hypothetical protein